MINNAKVIKEGDMTKRGNGFPYSWQSRKFILFPNKLDYYADSKLKGSFLIDETSTVERAEDEKPRAFRITTGENNLLMYTASDAQTKPEIPRPPSRWE